MKLVLILVGVAFLITFLEPIFEDVFNSATVLGASGGALLILSGVYLDKLPPSLRQTVFFIIILAVLAFVFLLASVYAEGKTNAKCEDVIIVLGCKVKGERPSLSLLKRIDSAYIFLLQNPNAVAILSGGQGRDEYISEALCMQRVLHHKGISLDRLILEDKSTSTEENIKYSLRIIKERQLSLNVAVATSEYHQRRAMMICKRYGLNAKCQSSKTKLTILPTFLFREVLGIIKEKIFHSTT